MILQKVDGANIKCHFIQMAKVFGNIEFMRSIKILTTFLSMVKMSG